MRKLKHINVSVTGALGFSVILVALILGASLSVPGVAEAGLYTIDTCADCHLYPPEESATRGTPEGAVVGSHAAHDTVGATCADCHVEPAVDEWNHSDGNINLATGAGDNGYGTGTTWAQTASPVLSNCTTASCHNDGTGAVDSPTWGSAGSGCTTCHGQPPATGKHAKHNGGFTMTDNQIADCDSPVIGCHVKPADATLGGNHINGTTEQTCSSTACHNTGLANASQGAVNTTDWANGTLTADCTWCHGNPPTSAPNFNHASWISSMACSDCHGHDGSGANHIDRDGTIDVTATCTTCHGQPPSGAAYPNTANAHDNHFSMTVTTNAPITDCTPCHTVPGTVVTANHPNAITEQSCDASTCHNNSLVSGGSTPNPAWNGGPFDCGWCHQNGTNTIPAHTYAPSGQYASNACINCHDHNGSGGTHLDGALTFPNIADCDACHNTSTPPTQGSHTVHIGGFTMIPTSRIGTDCTDCHTRPTVYNHANGTKEQSCSTVACHNNTTVLSATGSNPSPTWGTGTADCGWCHGNPPSTPLSVAADHTGVPGTTGCTSCHGHEGTGNPAAHINNAIDLTISSCTQCHGQPPTGVAAPNRDVDHQTHWTTTLTTNVDACTDCHAALPATYTHADGTTDMVADCYTSCHNSSAVTANARTNVNINAAPVWGTDGPATCEWCHDNPPTDPGAAYSHPGVTPGACASCHGHDGSGSAHMDGTVAPPSTNCASCHNYPPQLADSRVPWNVEADGAHDAHVTELASRTGLSLNSATDTYETGNTSAAVTGICGACHDLTDGNHEASGGTGTLDMGVNTQYQFAPGAPPTYNGTPGTPSSTTPKTCSSVSCHFTETPMWEDPAQSD